MYFFIMAFAHRKLHMIAEFLIFAYSILKVFVSLHLKSLTKQ